MRWVWEYQDQGIPWNKAQGLPWEARLFWDHFTAPSPPLTAELPSWTFIFHVNLARRPRKAQPRGVWSCKWGINQGGQFHWGISDFDSSLPLSCGPEYPFISFPFSFSLLAAKTEDKGNNPLVNPLAPLTVSNI